MTIYKCKNGQPPDENDQCNCNNVPDNYWASDCTCKAGSKKWFSGAGQLYCQCDDNKEVMDGDFNCKNYNKEFAEKATWPAILAIVGGTVLIFGGYYSYKYIRRIMRQNNGALFAPPAALPAIPPAIQVVNPLL